MSYTADSDRETQADRSGSRIRGRMPRRALVRLGAGAASGLLAAAAGLSLAAPAGASESSVRPRVPLLRARRPFTS